MLSRLSEVLRTPSLRARLTAWNAAVVILMTTATLLATRYAVRSTLYADADAELLAAARELALALDPVDTNVDAVVAEMRRKSTTHEMRGWFMHLLVADGTTIWKSDHCPDEVANFPPQRVDDAETVVQVGEYRYVRCRVDRDVGPAYLVRIGTYTTGLDQSLTHLLWPLVGVGLGLSVLTPLTAYWLALRATRPIGAILTAAKRLRPTRLDDRLPVRQVGDELDALSATINTLLDDVAAHVEQQDHFVADAAHELRGPLAALQSSLEVAISHDDTSPEQHDRLTDMLEATRHLSKVANDLLMLAAVGNESRPMHETMIDLATICRQAVAMFSGVAEERGVTLAFTTAGSTQVLGDVTSLRRVVSNLLDNAIRFTPPGGRIAIHVAHDPASDGTMLSVVDTGKGIAPRDLGRVFDRFYKADPSRTHGGELRSGGLGLAICKSIVESAGGTIGIASQPGEGTTVTLVLPRTREGGRPRQAAQSAAFPPAGATRAEWAADSRA
jgi:signal transduction histidine kinase